MVRGTQRRKHNRSPHRITAVSTVFVLMGFLVVGRLFFLQVIKYPVYNAKASGQHELLEDLLPHRGEVFARTENGLYPLVVNRELYTVFAVPSEISDPVTAADTLWPWVQNIHAKLAEFDAQYLDEDELVEVHVTSTEVVTIDAAAVDASVVNEEPVVDPGYEALVTALSKHDDPYEPILNGIQKEDLQVLQSLNIPGIHWNASPSRYYPEGPIGSHTLGFFSSLSDVKTGQYGIEGYWNEELQGEQGKLRTEKDASGRLISTAPRSLNRAENGADLVLTIDPDIQYTACVTLNEYVERFNAEGGSVVILDPDNGAVLALCGSPNFDPNYYNRVPSIDIYRHPAIAYSYEPGSIMKPITMAAGLDSGAITPLSEYFDEGEYSISGYTIKNSDLESHGTQNMTNVLELSLNTGVIYVAEEVGQKLFKKYFEAFGFGETTGIALSGEVAGTIASLDKDSFLYTATASFGQGITVTPLQMAAAFAAVANGGTLYKPYIVDARITEAGEQRTEPRPVRQVISPQASAMLAGMMVSVIENGHGDLASVPGYLIAGKTGTAQVAGAGGSYTDKTIQSFVGFGPVDDPIFTMVVKLDNPETKFSSASAAPLFGDIADFILKYYHVPPTER